MHESSVNSPAQSIEHFTERRFTMNIIIGVRRRGKVIPAEGLWQVIPGLHSSRVKGAPSLTGVARLMRCLQLLGRKGSPSKKCRGHSCLSA
jgi:hypothetical protein